MTTQARTPDDEAPPDAAGEASLCLVLVEDDRDYAWLVEEMLREAFPGRELEVFAFTTLGAAVEHSGAADCALVDLSLPDGRGLEVIDRVQEALPGVPLVVLTGAEDEQLALQAVERGAQDYLVKRRVEPDALGRSMRDAIERRRAERQRAELLQARAAHAEAEALSGTLSRLQAVSDAAIAVQGDRLDHDELLERSLAVIAAEAGMLVLADPESGRLAPVAVRGMPGVAVGQTLEPDGLIARAAIGDGALVMGDVGDAAALEAGIRSMVSVPLDAEGVRLGALLAISGLPERFSQEQGRLLALAAERCARGLANAHAYERERRTSATLQTGLLPHPLPPLEHGEIAARFLPARGGPPVGGDWYDAIVLPDGRIGLAIGDVTGHGAQAAVLMGQMRAALRAFALEGSSPAIVASRLNALALSLGDAAIATLVYILLEPDLSSGAFVNLGHPPPVVVSRNGAEELPGRSSPPAGASTVDDFDEHPLALGPGDAVCLYSDGLVEERGADRIERERELLEALGRSASAEVLCERALAALRPEGAGEDDVALLILRPSADAEGLRISHPATPEALREARASLREWLVQVGADRGEVSDVLMSCNEACMNVVEHAYGDEDGAFTLEGHLDEQTVVIIVRDHGRWSEVRSRGHGRGLKLMEGLMDSVQLSFSAEGTVVVLRKTLAAPALA